MTRIARFPIVVSAGYLVFACIWILGGDAALTSMGMSEESLSAYHTPKALLFIALTSVLLYFHTAAVLRQSQSRQAGDAPHQRSLASATSPTLPLVGAGVLFIFAVGAAGSNLRRNYDQSLDAARQSNSNLASALTHELEQTIASVDISLRAIASEVAKAPISPASTLAAIQLQKAQQELLPQTQSMFALDRDGNLVSSSDGVAKGTSFGDRIYFTALREHPGMDLFVGSLIRSRIDNQPFIAVAKPVRNVKGDFEGVVVARLDPHYFERQFYKLDVGTNGAIALVTDTGLVAARSPPLKTGEGPSTNIHSILLDGTRMSGTFDAKSTIDGHDRIYAFERLRSSPLTILIGRDRSDVLSSWRMLLRNASLTLTVFVAVLFALGLLLQRQVRRQMQLIEKLRVSELRFLSFLSNTPAMAWITDGDGTVIYANQALARLVDHDEEHLIGRNLDELLPHGPSGSHAKNIATVASRLANIETIQPGPNGTASSDLLIQYFALGEADGQHRVGGIALDVTKQREAERAFALHDRVLRSSPHGVSISLVSGDMPLIYVNPAFERITGYSAEEVLGRNCRFLQGADRDQDALIEMRSALFEQRETEVTLRNYRKDGSLFWNETRLAPVRDSAGQVTHYVGTLVDVTERKNFEEQLAFQGSHDLLTRLPNRTLFEEFAEAAIAKARQQRELLALVFIDIDHFQQCNDSLGRGGGDLLLKRVADRLEQVTGGTGTVGRVGGDEFALVLGSPTEQEIQATLRRLFDAFKDAERVGEFDVAISISAGVALFPRDAYNVVDLSKDAELAMNSAKEAGGGVVHWFAPHMDQQAAERLGRESRLRGALDRNELVLHYQPQIDARTGKVIGVEALMRWEDPTVGLVYPARFIPLAEDTGLIVPMGEWAMREACRQNRQWQLGDVMTAPIAVNVSIAQFRQPNFAKVVEGILEETGLAAKYLEIEITESLVMDDPELFINTLSELKRLGVCISIDDFGTGYSSLNYLKRLPIDKLKIDRSFVGDITQDPDDAALCRSIVDIAHSLRLLAIAEGVETDAQSHFLARHHCDQLQGYLFCKPLAAHLVKDQLMRIYPTGFGDDDRSYRTSQLVLLVDDDEDSGRALMAAIESQNVKVRLVRSASEAFEVLAIEDVALIIADYRMPDMNGVALLTRVKLLYPETIRMIVTAYPGYEQAAEAINHAAIYKFLVKPWQADSLREDVSNALELHRRLTDDLRLRDTLDYSRGTPRRISQ